MSTFQAYNNYGGKSLYNFNSIGNTTVAGTARAVKVSYDRPFEQPRSGLRDWYTNTEFASVYWLEQSGYDVSYISNTDLEAGNWLLRTTRRTSRRRTTSTISSGMRSAMTSARDAGVDLFFTRLERGLLEDPVREQPRRRARQPRRGLLQDRRERRRRSERRPDDAPGAIPTAPNKPENALTRRDVHRRQRHELLPARRHRRPGHGPDLPLHAARDASTRHLHDHRQQPRRLGVGRPRRATAPSPPA